MNVAYKLTITDAQAARIEDGTRTCVVLPSLTLGPPSHADRRMEYTRYGNAATLRGCDMTRRPAPDSRTGRSKPRTSTRASMTATSGTSARSSISDFGPTWSARSRYRLDRHLERLSEVFAAQRARRSLSYRAVAAQSGVSVSSLRRLEIGGVIDLRTAVGVLRWLGWSGSPDAATA